MVGFRAKYHLDYRQVLHEMWWVDIAILADGLDEWSATDENIARLVDREDYWLNSEYSSWITDPDDPEVRDERARRKMLGIKPPKTPLLWPVAVRPIALQEKLAAQAVEAAEKASQVPRRKITIAELRQMRGK